MRLIRLYRIYRNYGYTMLGALRRAWSVVRPGI